MLSPTFRRAIEWSNSDQPVVPPAPEGSTPFDPRNPPPPVAPGSPLASGRDDHYVGGHKLPNGATLANLGPGSGTTNGTTQLPVPSSSPTGASASANGGGAAYNPYVTTATTTDWKKYVPWLGVLIFVVVLFTVLRKKR